MICFDTVWALAAEDYYSWDLSLHADVYGFPKRNLGLESEF